MKKNWLTHILASMLAAGSATVGTLAATRPPPTTLVTQSAHLYKSNGPRGETIEVEVAGRQLDVTGKIVKEPRARGTATPEEYLLLKKCMDGPILRVLESSTR